jgi:pilus assembly protein CpaC
MSASYQIRRATERSAGSRLALRAGVALLMAGLVAGASLPLAAPSFAEETGVKITQSDTARAKKIEIGMGKSIVIDLPRDAKEVFVANPAIANAVVRSARKVFVIAMAVGQTSLFFMDAEGRQIAAVDVNVQRDVGPIKSAIDQTLPGNEITVQQLNDGVLLGGTAASAEQAAQASAIAARFINNPQGVTSSITIKGGEQVMLKVTVAEVQRQVLKQLGVNLNGGFSVGTLNIGGGAVTRNPLPVNSGLLGGGYIQFGDSTNNATLQAFERAGVIRTLAEPNMTAISGETAKFLAGGEVPVVESVTVDAGVPTVTYEYKEIGVTLDFTPVVLNSGRINLKVATEVREIDPQTSTISSVDGITLPGFKARRANTTVEVPSGGSLVMAGMIQNQSKQVVNGVPGLMNMPILGQLFRSRDFQRNETELMIMVTPYLVKPIERNQVSLPTDGFADADDTSTFLLGRLNRLYGSKAAQVPNPNLNGRYGFIID